MRHEGDRHAELLLDLGAVAVAEHAVGGDAAVALREVRPLGRRLAGAGDARLGVDDDARLEQPGRDERLQRQHRGGRIAARRRRPAGRRRARRGGARSGRRRAGGRRRASADTTACGLGDVAKPERAREIEHAHAALGQRRRDLGRQRVGHGQEDRVGPRRQLLEVERLDRRIPDLGQRRQAPRFRAARSPSRRRTSDPGWPARRRSSSTPAYPVAPATPTRTREYSFIGTNSYTGPVGLFQE